MIPKMFCQNNYQMTVFSGESQMTTTPKKKTKKSDKFRSRVEKQKERRYQMLCYRRFISSKEYGTPTSDDGCLSDDSDSGYSSGSRSSSFSFESYSFGQLLTDLYSCQPLPQLETQIVAIVSRLTDLVINNDISDDDNNGLDAIVINLLSLEFVNKLSTFVGRKGLSFRAQVYLYVCLLS